MLKQGQKNILRTWRELVALASVFAIFYFSPRFLAWLEPSGTVGAFDLGIFQINIYAVVSFLLIQFTVWILLNTVWNFIGEYFTLKMQSDFYDLTPFQRICVSLFVYFSLVFALVLLSRALDIATPRM